MRKILFLLLLFPFFVPLQLSAQSVSDAYSSATPGQAYEPDYSDHKKKQADDDDSANGIYDSNNPSPDHNANSGHNGHSGGYGSVSGGGYGGHGGGHR